MNYEQQEQDALMNAAAPEKRKPLIPTIGINHPDFVWYSSAQTDVTRTWRRFGWRPLAEQQQTEVAA